MPSSKLFLSFLFICLSFTSFAQNFNINGTIKDARNGEDLIGATVRVLEIKDKGTRSNTYGYYAISLPKGTYTLVYQYLGYEKKEIRLVVNGDVTTNIQLSPVEKTMKDVVIKAVKEDKNVTRTEMGVIKLDPRSIETVPVLFGEKDILKTLQMTPGVKSAGEGQSGFYVRGGGVDQNLILLDEAPVYNASHLLGFFSVFNSDALKDVTLYKGDIPAEFGGRASSVLDVKMKDGNSKHYSASGGIGLIASRLTLEGPIVKEKGSFIVSGRRTYADLFLKLSSDSLQRESKLYFYDLNLKANYQVTKKDRIFLSGYFGRDIFGLGSTFGFDWGNTTSTIRWNHVFHSKLFSNTSLIYSDYSYQIKAGFNDQSFKISSSIRDYNVKQDFSWFANQNNNIKFGFNIMHHTFRPTVFSGTGLTVSDTLKNRYALEGGVYIQNEQTFNDKISLKYGLRLSGFDYLGPGTAYTYDSAGQQTSKKSYTNGQTIKMYGGLEPRISGRYQLNEVSSVKASYNRNFQYLHLLSNSTTSSPTDIWVPSSNNVKPQIADQIAIGYFRNFKDNMFEFSVETYYKWLQNQIDYKNGADLFLNTDIEAELEYGKGRAYGAEFYLHKQSGRLTGWVSYTLSRSLRTFKNINNGNEYAAKQDRIHDIAIVAMYDLTKKLKVSANWVYNTGSAVTFPSGSYVVDGNTVPYYTERNGYRMPAYHRMDVGITWERKKTEKRESSWNFSLYNAYGRENAYSISFQQNPDNPDQTEALQTSLFRWIPSITYNFKF
ncbi:MAG: TonB-dependent receptor [Chitinophagaceae bacterium]|nr:TonB-dependent receptor [Chitinophagaceae bacterium]